MSNQHKLPFVWQLDYQGVTSYLVGTNHCAPDCFKDDIEARINGIKQILVECDFSAQDNRTLYHKIEAAGGSCATDIELLSDNEQQELAALAKIPLVTLKEMPSLGVVPYILMTHVNPDFKAVEEVIENVAEHKKIPVFGLESIDEQIDALGVSPGASTTALKRVLFLNQKYGGFRQWFEMFGEAYVNKDSEKLSELCVIGSFSESEAEHIISRNKRLAERSISYLRTPSVVAIGVGHCIIEPSMQTLYEQNGVDVKRVE